MQLAAAEIYLAMVRRSFETEADVRRAIRKPCLWRSKPCALEEPENLKLNLRSALEEAQV